MTTDVAVRVLSLEETYVSQRGISNPARCGCGGSRLPPRLANARRCRDRLLEPTTSVTPRVHIRSAASVHPSLPMARLTAVAAVAATLTDVAASGGASMLPHCSAGRNRLGDIAARLVVEPAHRRIPRHADRLPPRRRLGGAQRPQVDPGRHHAG